MKVTPVIQKVSGRKFQAYTCVRSKGASNTLEAYPPIILSCGFRFAVLASQTSPSQGYSGAAARARQSACPAECRIRRAHAITGARSGTRRGKTGGGRARTTRCTSREHATHACRRHASPTREPRPTGCPCWLRVDGPHPAAPVAAPLSLLSQTYLSFGQGGHRACAKCEDRGRVETRALPRGQRRKVADTRQ